MTYVLIVTEDRAVALSLRMVLKDAFFVADVTPAAARHSVVSHRPAVILLDGRTVSGALSLLKELLTDDPALTVVMLCPSCDWGAREALATGAFDVIEKSFDIERVAAADSTLLLIGPTGVGKELVARYIHQESARRDESSVAIHGAAIPEAFFESELFGHERGAFTGALQRRIGKIEPAGAGRSLSMRLVMCRPCCR